MHWVHRDVTGATAANAEGGYFGHVNPDTIERDLSVPGNHLISPPVACTWPDPIWEDCVPRPNITNVETTVWIGHERMSSVASVESRIPEIFLSTDQNSSLILEYLRVTGIIRIRHIDRRIDNRYIVAPTSMQSRQEFLTSIVIVSDSIVVEVTVLIHVVDVGPDQELAKSQLIGK